eukprot:COSAG02_NODE_5281_length_4474_cov_265.284114_1_plen_268_part_00
MDGGVAPPPVSHVGSVSHGGAQGRYIAEGWLHKRSSNHHLHKDKFVKRWFMIENTAVGPALSYCPSPDDRTLSKDPLVRRPASSHAAARLSSRRPCCARRSSARGMGSRAAGASPCASSAATLEPRLDRLIQKADPSDAPVRSQPLDDVLTVHEGFSDKKYSCGLEHCEFQITTERQVLLFRAGSREERDAWIENLKPIMQGYLLHALITQHGVRTHPLRPVTFASPPGHLLRAWLVPRQLELASKLSVVRLPVIVSAHAPRALCMT